MLIAKPFLWYVYVSDSQILNHLGMNTTRLKVTYGTFPFPTTSITDFNITRRFTACWSSFLVVTMRHWSVWTTLRFKITSYSHHNGREAVRSSKTSETQVNPQMVPASDTGRAYKNGKTKMFLLEWNSVTFYSENLANCVQNKETTRFWNAKSFNLSLPSGTSLGELPSSLVDKRNQFPDLTPWSRMSLVLTQIFIPFNHFNPSHQ